MEFDFSNIKVHPLQIANNDISESWVQMCKLLTGLDKVELPSDYLEFIKKFGEGLIGGHIKIYPISKLIGNTKFWRGDNQTRAEVSFFKKHKRNDCTMIGETLDGDIIIYLMGLYYFSTRQNEERIYKLGNKFVDILEFFKNDRRYGEVDVNRFVPFDSSL